MGSRGAGNQSVLAHRIAEKWADLIDLDAGRIATGHATIEDVGWELFRLILDMAGPAVAKPGRSTGASETR